MYLRMLTAIILILTSTASLWADLPWNGPGPRPPRPMPHDFPPPLPPQLEIAYDSGATTAKLILPAKLIAAITPAESPRVASGLPNALLGLTFAGSLIAAGLWLARQPRAKYVVAFALPLFALTLIAAAHAQPARLAAPRAIVETGKVRISRDAGASNIRLVLPAKPAAK